MNFKSYGLEMTSMSESQEVLRFATGLREPIRRKVDVRNVMKFSEVVTLTLRYEAQLLRFSKSSFPKKSSSPEFQNFKSNSPSKEPPVSTPSSQDLTLLYSSIPHVIHKYMDKLKLSIGNWETCFDVYLVVNLHSGT